MPMGHILVAMGPGRSRLGTEAMGERVVVQVRKPKLGKRSDVVGFDQRECCCWCQPGRSEF